MKRHLRRALGPGLALGVALGGCSTAGVPAAVTNPPQSPAPAASLSQAPPSPAGQAAASTPVAPASQAQTPATLGQWVPFRHMTEPVDLAGPHADGSFTVAADGRLFTLSRAGTVTPFAQGAGGYSTKVGPEPYIALPGSDPVAATKCSFPGDAIFALDPSTKHPGVIEIAADGRATRFVNLPATGLPDGIAYDATGDFGHRLLVAITSKTATTVLALDCAAGLRMVTTQAPIMEGGMAVAPASFGRYGGDLVGTNERTGQVFAVAPGGTTTTIAVSGLPHGPDTGVESAGFVPPGFGSGDSAYLADRYTKNNPHPGTDNILRLPGSALTGAGAAAGDLVIATEGSARTILVTCAIGCAVKYIAIGPAITHGEGHIVFTRPG